MDALTLLLASLGIFAVAYRYYGLFIAHRVLEIDPSLPTPAQTMNDNVDYVPTHRTVLFGHHFAAIAAAGPLLGPVLAAQFGYLPGALWIILGTVLAGAVHDMVALFASVRHRGRSLARIAQAEIGRTTGAVASVAVLFILILAMAGLSIAVVNALAQSPWGTFTVAATIPIALVMGFYMQVWRPGSVWGPSALGVVLLALAVWGGAFVAARPELAAYFTYSKKQLAVLIPLYGFAASVLPVWMLLCPRDYLSTYLKIGTIGLLTLGLVYIRPAFQMPALTQFVHGGGPIIPGTVFPFVFITIACGALSGFHAVVASGTTPKMISSERDIPFVGFGAMLVEGFVAVVALIAACVMVPADYFAINSLPEAYARLGMTPAALPDLAREVGENIQGRPGGAVSLAVGMTHIFSSLPRMKELAAYWYHYAIVFEAVFILTAIDAGTRVGRFFLQEALGKIYPRFMEKNWVPGLLICGFLFTFAWGYLVYTGEISTIWPLFGMSNQLLAASTLIILTAFLVRLGKARYCWMTLVPGLVMVAVTFTAGYQNIFSNYLPQGKTLLAVLSAAAMVLMAVVIGGALVRGFELLKIRGTVRDAHGRRVVAEVEE